MTDTPPWEACDGYPWVRPTDWYFRHHALLAAKDAEIAELRALLQRFVNLDPSSPNERFFWEKFGLIRSESKAALAQKEGT